MAVVQDMLTVGARCRSCNSLSTVTMPLQEAREAKGFPALCQGCNTLTVMPLKDGELDRPSDAFEMQVLLSKATPHGV
jgi:hypothetical protein